MEKIETGVMVMKDGKAWGVKYADGHSTEFGWIDPIDAPIHDKKFCEKTTDVTHKNSHYIPELETAILVNVERKTSTQLKFI